MLEGREWENFPGKVRDIMGWMDWSAVFGGPAWEDDSRTHHTGKRIMVPPRRKGANNPRGFMADRARPWPEGPFTLEGITTLPLEAPVTARQSVEEEALNDRILVLLERIGRWDLVAVYAKRIIRNLIVIATSHARGGGEEARWEPSGPDATIRDIFMMEPLKTW
jgi:hypothetical protein